MQGQNGSGGPTPTASPPTGTGAWQWDSHGVWQWIPTATPDPTLVSQWGYAAITNVQQAPNGVPNSGSWSPVHGGGWTWTWGSATNLAPNLVDSYGAGALTDPDHLPGSGTATTANQLPPPDVNTPVLSDVWHGNPPDVTGTPVGGGGGPAVSTPPAHAPYTVAPGGIRDAEEVVLGSLDVILGDYATLKGQVDAAKGQNVYMAGAGDLINTQDQGLLQVGDALELAGQFVSALNNAAQYYARADLDSYLPQS